MFLSSVYGVKDFVRLALREDFHRFRCRVAVGIEILHRKVPSPAETKRMHDPAYGLSGLRLSLSPCSEPGYLFSLLGSLLEAKLDYYLMIWPRLLYHI